MSSITESWETFFRNCGLPKNVHRKYAQRFVKERIQPSMLKDIGKSELTDLGVETLGDQLCILRYIKSTDGILDEFRSANKQKAAVAPDNGDDIYMDSDLSDFDEPVQKSSVKVQPVEQRKVSSREKKESAHRVSGHSRVIRKKPVMIHDVSSSSPLPPVGKMRSDAISMKTMVVADDSPKRGLEGARRAVKTVTNRTQGSVVESRRDLPSNHGPDFHVRLNVRPQTKYDNALFGDTDVGFEDSAVSISRAANLVSVSAGGVRRFDNNVRTAVGARRDMPVIRQRPTVAANERLGPSVIAGQGIASRVTVTRRKPVITVARGRIGGTAIRRGGGILSRVSILPK